MFIHSQHFMWYLFAKSNKFISLALLLIGLCLCSCSENDKNKIKNKSVNISPEAQRCIDFCNNNDSLIGLKPMVALDPIKLCADRCIATNGYCPAADGSGGPYTGCAVCGATGGIFCDGRIR